MAFNGTGTTISFASSFLAEILDISGPGLSREAIPTSHMGTTGGMTFIPGDLYDGGELTVEIAFNPDDDPPIGSAAETITIAFSDSASTSWSFTGFMSGFEASTPLEGRATGSATIKIAGSINFNA